MQGRLVRAAGTYCGCRAWPLAVSQRPPGGRRAPWTLARARRASNLDDLRLLHRFGVRMKAMFLDQLSSDEQKVYCQLAYAVMAADGEVAEKEAAFHDRTLRDLVIEELPEPASGGGVLVPDGAFRLSVSRRALLVELALLAVVDGELTAEERSVLDAVAEQMDFTPFQVEQCLEYAVRLRDVLDEGVVLLAEGD